MFFAENRLFYRALLQKRLVILRSVNVKSFATCDQTGLLGEQYRYFAANMGLL